MAYVSECPDGINVSVVSDTLVSTRIVICDIDGRRFRMTYYMDGRTAPDVDEWIPGIGVFWWVKRPDWDTLADMIPELGSE